MGDFIELAIEGFDRVVQHGFEPTWDRASNWRKKRRSSTRDSASPEKNTTSRSSRSSPSSRDDSRDSPSSRDSRRSSQAYPLTPSQSNQVPPDERDKVRGSRRDPGRDTRGDRRAPQASSSPSSSGSLERAPTRDSGFSSSRRDKRARRNKDADKDGVRPPPPPQVAAAAPPPTPRKKSTAQEMGGLRRQRTSRDTAPDARRHSRPVYAF